MLNQIFDIIIITHSYDDIIFNDIVEFGKLCVNRRCILLLDDTLCSDECKSEVMEIKGLQITNSFNELDHWITQSSKNILLLDSRILITNNWETFVSTSLANDASIGTISPLLANRIGYKCLNIKTLERLERITQLCSLDLNAETMKANELCVCMNRKVFDYGITLDWNLLYDYEQMIIKFCARVSQFGLRHIISDSFLVYDSRSLSNEDSYIEDKMLYVIYDNIKLHLLTDNNKKNILLELHSDFILEAENSIGGTQLHVKDLVNGLRDKFNLYVVARDGPNLNLTIYVAKKELHFKFYVGARGKVEQFYNKKYKDIYMTIIKAFHIDLIHIHHVLGMTREIFYIGAELHIPMIASIHDYYYVCPCTLMLDGEGKLCIGNENADTCSKCLQSRLGLPADSDYLKIWRSESIKVLDLCEKLVVPSNSTKYNFIKYFPQLEENINVIEHGVNIQKIQIQSRKEQKKDFHVAFVGSLGPEKGSRYAYEMVRNGPQDIFWFIIGNIEEYPLLLLEQKNLVKLGSYKREDLPQLLDNNEVDLVCILSICPETYSYTLTEVLCCGVPVMVMDSGALGERVRKLDCGWIVPAKSTYKDILRTLEAVRSDGESYKKVRDHIDSLRIRNITEMTNDYETLYNPILKSSIKSFDYDSNLIYHAYLRANGDKLDIAYANDIAVYAELESLRSELNEIKHSWTYLVATKIIKKIKIPFKKELKKYIFRNR